MKINNVKLKNYRTHSELDIDFSEGINLLLGSNGAGKTSVLEAIGIAMFDTGNRSTVKETIQNGEKTASIIVDFTGNDSVEYIVERKMGSTNRHRLFEKENPENELSGKTEVIAKITELCGIKKNSSKIYESVVTVKQNEIVNIFLTKNNEREETFNEIFDTEIYRKIYKNYSREILSKYEHDIEITEVKINEIAGMLIDVETFKGRLNENKAIKLEKDEKKEQLIKEKKESEIKKKELDSLKENIKNLTAQLTSKNELLNSLKKQSEKIEQNILKAEEAKDIVIANREDYLKYKEDNKELRTLQEKLRELDKVKLEKDELYSKMVKIEKEIIGLNSNIDKIQEQIKINLEITEKLEKEKEHRLEKYNSNLEKEKEFHDEIKLIEKTVIQLEKELKNQTELEKKLFLKKSEVSKIKEILENFDEISSKSQLEELEKTIVSLNEEKKEKENFENRKKELVVLLGQNSEAGEILSSGICPYLQENCKNIKDHANVNEYFTSKETKLNEEKSKILNSLKKFEDLEVRETKVLEEKNRIIMEENNFKTKNEELKYLEKELENVNLLISNNKFELREKITLININDGLKEDLENFRFNEIYEKYKNMKTVVETNLKHLGIEDILKELQKINLELKTKTAEIKSFETNLEKIKLTIESFNKELEEIKLRSDEFSEKLKEHSELKDQEHQIIISIENLKQAYEIYMGYITTAKTLHGLQDESKEIKNRIEETGEEITEIQNKLESSKSNYDESKNLILTNLLEELNSKLEIITKDIYEIEYLIKEDTKELKRYQENKSKIQILSQESSKLKKKIALTNKFREYINKIGKNISKQMIEKIALVSTENFREITGRSEMIQWQSNEKESYMLSLVDDVGERKFNMLSGGEQVAVALAVRSAMASTLSKANFTIFDEPTNNLDEERRKALADSISKILKGIKQSIIVTHDDTFEEMANKIIKL